MAHMCAHPSPTCSLCIHGYSLIPTYQLRHQLPLEDTSRTQPVSYVWLQIFQLVNSSMVN